jgi:hypothetical protein
LASRGAPVNSGLRLSQSARGAAANESRCACRRRVLCYLNEQKTISGEKRP